MLIINGSRQFIVGFLHAQDNIKRVGFVFTTVTLGNNISMESVSKMLGHKSIKTTQHYAKILDSKVSQDMGNLKLVLEKKNEVQKENDKKIGS